MISRSAGAGLFLCAALQSGVMLAAGETAKFQHRDFQGPESCAPCHPRHYQEWRGSPHAYSTVDPIFQACNRLAQKETGGKIGSFCVNCHVPLGARTGEVRDTLEGVELTPLARAGVSCEVCHRMEPPGAGKPVANASFELNAGGAFFGPILQPVSSPAHQSAASDYLGESAFCGSCHDVIHNSALLEKTFAQWTASAYPERSAKCQDCHMLRYSGQAAVGGPFRETLRRHNFPAVSIPLVQFPNRGYQEEQVQEFLRTAVRLAVLPPPMAQAGADLLLTVRVKNSGAGHNIPTGLANERQMWIEVTASDEGGAAIFSSGRLDADGDLMDHHSRSRAGADPALVSFSDRFLDDQNREVTFIWQASRLDERSLKPLEERSAVYRVPLPTALSGSSVRIKVRLLFRSFAPYALRALGLDHLVKELPVWEMASFESGAIPVVAELPRKRTHQVPGDFPDLASAIERAQAGDTIVVEPGEHRLDRPLDFGGKSLRVQSRAGADRTTLRLRTSPDAPEASVVVFRGGEGPEAVLAGFTITGGRGTEAGGVRRGGGILILRSSPTIAANRIIDNQAPSGEGGGIYCEDGHPTLAANRVEACRAKRGGGLALRFGGVSGESITIRGGSIQGNIAEDRGGGLLLQGGDIDLDHCVIAGNIAGTEGGGLSVGEGTALRLDRSTVTQNRAGTAGGALATGAPNLVRVTSSIFWDNTPPGCAPPSCSAIFSYCMVDLKAEASPTNKSELPIFYDSQGYWERKAAASGGEGGAQDDPGRWVEGDYRIRPGSPAIDAGDPDAPADPDDSRADMGAFFFEAPLKAFIRADVDGDGIVEQGDLGLLIERLILRKEVPCLDAADVNDDGRVDCLDAVSLALYVLTGQPQPAAPFRVCGLDPTFGEGLSCDHKAAPCKGSQ